MGGRTGINTLNVTVGYFCNLTCAHCVSDSGPKREKGLAEKDIGQLCHTVRDSRPRELLFTGGEPTFQVRAINRIVEAHPCPDSLIVTVTTNGWFARSQRTLERQISSFRKIDRIYLSYDQWHQPSLHAEDIARLYAFCRSRRIEFVVQVTYADLYDILAIGDIMTAAGNPPITLSVVEPAGRARVHAVEGKPPTILSDIIDLYCPNKGTVTYLPRMGFSICCGKLVYDGDFASYTDETLTSHITSSFFREMSNTTFREQLENKGIKLESLDNQAPITPCGLCEIIHRGVT